VLALAFLTAGRAWTATAAPESPAGKLLVKAEAAAAKDKNWADARALYDQARETKGDWFSSEARLAVERAIACSVQLEVREISDEMRLKILEGKE
jgi:hypothetical protein